MNDKPELCSQRQALCSAAQRFSELGLSPGRSGNISCRVEGGMLISASGSSLAALSATSTSFVDREGCARDSATPSSEWPMHLAVYRQYPECAAITHCHSPAATTLACLHQGIPAFHYMVAAAGGDQVACSAYALFGSEALSQLALAALDGRRACLLGNHGQLSWGHSLESAIELAATVEWLARCYIDARQTGEPKLLSPAEMRDVMTAFENYPAAGKTS